MINNYLLIPVIVLIPVLIINTKCHTANNNSDVIIAYSNHAEADLPQRIFTEPKSTTTDNTRIEMSDTIVNYKTTTELVEMEEAKHDIVFIPNDKPVERNFNNYDGVKLNDLITMRTVGDVINGQNIQLETEAPLKDIIFVSGKNNENVEKQPKSETHGDTRRSETRTTNEAKKLNCTRLECTNTVKTVCGAKMDNKRWRYRLFLNDCYYRKVNCGFRYEMNRYKVTEMDNCKSLGSRNTDQSFSFKVEPVFIVKPEKINNTRRNSSSRRSLTMAIDGQFCTHPCPVSCPDDYNPECAVSGTGQRRVFVNHCKMDYNSCFYGVVWHKRPLSECVGGRKADMRQNRGFVGWMQRVGIIDKKGRLVLS